MPSKPSSPRRKKAVVPAPLPPEAQARVAAAAAAAATPKPGVPASVPTAAAPAKPITPKVQFVMDAPFAEHVHVAGDFNGWEISSLPLRKDADGLWRASVEIAPGRYAYKFLVDGQWVNDPNSPVTEPNEFGSLNNIIEVKAVAK